jgi:hypothetical protein
MQNPDTDEIVWACGYRIKQSNRPYRDWFYNEREMQKDAFSANKMNLRKFRDDIYGADTDLQTGLTSVRNPDQIKKFENYIRSQGYQVKKVHNMSAYALWQFWVFKPCFDTMAGNKDWKDGPTTYKDKDASFNFITVCGPIYDKLIVQPILNAWGVTPKAGYSDYKIGRIKALKEFRRAVIDVVRNRIAKDQLPRSWEECVGAIKSFGAFKQVALSQTNSGAITQRLKDVMEARASGIAGRRRLQFTQSDLWNDQDDTIANPYANSRAYLGSHPNLVRKQRPRKSAYPSDWTQDNLWLAGQGQVPDKSVIQRRTGVPRGSGSSSGSSSGSRP